MMHLHGFLTNFFFLSKIVIEGSNFNRHRLHMGGAAQTPCSIPKVNTSSINDGFQSIISLT